MRRHGSVLIVCIGLLAVLLALGLAFLARMRLSADESLQLVREAQARVMLQSACHYLMESSRMGWAPLTAGLADSDAEAATLMECCGWTDVRDGSLGPRPIPLPSGTPKPSWWRSSWPAYPTDAKFPPVPPPVWWTYSKPYNMTPGAWDNLTAKELGLPSPDSNLPPADERKWPCPGSTVRVDAYRVTRPTFAVVPAYTLNPVILPLASVPALTEPYPGDFPATEPGKQMNPRSLYSDTFNAVIGTTGQQGTGMGALDPQPISNTYALFAAGDPTPVTSSENLAWFRIYREVGADHDNIPVNPDPLNPKDPDRVPMRGYSTFIIACGAGSSHGFRFWDKNEPGYSEAIEPVTASASGLFPDKDFFEQQRSVERILWFRVEWSGWQGGNVHSVYMYRSGHLVVGWRQDGDGFMYGRAHGTWNGVTSNLLYPQHLNGLGNIAWIQRLDREPPKW